MLDEFCYRLYPPCHELLSPEEFQLFLVRFFGKDAGDFYQVSPGIDKGVQGIDLFLGQPLAWVMLQASLSEIAVQTDATFLGKFFELRPDFIGTSESMYSSRRFLCYVLFLHCQYLLMKGMNINWLERRTRSASLRVARETFRSAKTGSPVLYYKRISRKVPLKYRGFYLQSSRQGLEVRFGFRCFLYRRISMGWWTVQVANPSPSGLSLVAMEAIRIGIAIRLLIVVSIAIELDAI